MKLLSFEFNEKLSKYYFKFDKFSFEYVGSHILINRLDWLFSTSEDRWRNKRTGECLEKGTTKVKKDITKLIASFMKHEIQIKRINQYDLILEADNGSKLILFSDDITVDNHIGCFEFIEFYDIKYQSLVTLENKIINKIDTDCYDDYINFMMQFDDMNLCIYCCSKVLIGDEIKFISYELRKEENQEKPLLKLSDLLLNKKILNVKMYTQVIYRFECEDNIFIYLYLDSRFKYYRYLSLFLEKKGLVCDLSYYGHSVVLIERIS